MQIEKLYLGTGPVGGGAILKKAYFLTFFVERLFFYFSLSRGVKPTQFISALREELIDNTFTKIS